MNFEKYGLTSTLMLTVFTTCFGSSFQIGYNLAILNQPAKNIEAFLKDTMPNNDPQQIYVIATAIFVVAAAMGSFSCGWIADGIGRRNGLLINHFFAITGGILIGPCVVLKQPILLLIGRVVIGINCGITIGVASLYLTEVAPRDLRGGIGACHQLAVTIGIAFAYLITLSHFLNRESLWPIAAALGAVPAAISLILLPMCPESPRFLFLKKHKENEARNAFIKLNIQENVDTFLSELQKENEFAKSQPAFKFQQLFVQKDLRVPIVIACLIQVMQQLSGINAVISYSSKMLTMAKVPPDSLEYCVFGIGIFNVIVTIAALPLLERAGRRTLLLWPSLILAISLLILTLTVNLSEKISGKMQDVMAILSIVFIFVYIFGFALGLGPVPGLIVSEIFRQGPRAAAYSLSQTIQWLSNLLVLFSTPNLMDAIEGYTFLIFLVIVVACWIFFFLYMPETKNRTFDDIAEDLSHWHAVSFRSNKNTSNSNSNSNSNNNPNQNSDLIFTRNKNLSNSQSLFRVSRHRREDQVIYS